MICKALLRGKILSELILPYPTLSVDETETVNILLDSLRKFAKEGINPEKIDREAKIPQEVLDKLWSLGIFGMIIPQEYGGAELSMTAYCKVMGELTTIDASTAVTVGAHQSIGIKGILRYGTEEQKKKYLPTLSTSKNLAAYALTEPAAGSDAASIKSTAVLDPSGKHYVLNGSKQWITNAGLANLFTVFAKTEVEKAGKKEMKITAFLVARDTPGFSVGKEEDKMGIRGSTTNPLQFENVTVPREDVLGEVGNGFKIALEILDEGRLGIAAGCVETSKKLINLSVVFAKEREQFGKPVGSFELIKKKIEEMAVSTFVAESMVYLTAGLVDKKIKDFALEAAICKVYASEALWQNVNHALQIHGGNGYMREYPFERMLRDARINMIFEGTNEILRFFIAGMGLRDVGRGLTPAKVISRKIAALFSYPKMSKVDSSLRVYAGYIEKITRLLQGKALNLLIRYGKKIGEKEFILERISGTVINLYGMLASVSRLDSLIKQEGKAKLEQELAIVSLFCKRAYQSSKTLLRNLERDEDKLINKISDHIVLA